MIRVGTLADLDALVPMALDFLSRPPFADLWSVDAACVRRFITRMLTGDSSVGFIAEQDGTVVGMLGGALYRHPFSDELVAQEIGWWMTPSARGTRLALLLLREFERWGRSAGAVLLQVQAPSEKVGRFYLRHTYAPYEWSYQRRLV